MAVSGGLTVVVVVVRIVVKPACSRVILIAPSYPAILH